jgi:hypothetical protein
MVHLFYRGVAQHGLARLPWEQEVAGSNPVAPILKQILNPNIQITNKGERDFS